MIIRLGIACLFLIGCADDTPTCKQAIDSLHKHMKGQPGTWLNTYIGEHQCTADKYSASVRRCLAKARNGSDLEACARGNAPLQKSIEEGRAMGKLFEQRVAANAIHEFHVAYKAWSKTHPDKPCPASLRDLAPGLPTMQLAQTDPWGSPFTMRCSAEAFEVIALGPDKQLGGGDDIDASWVDPQLR